jgi:hypothetical protein
MYRHHYVLSNFIHLCTSRNAPTQVQHIFPWQYNTEIPIDCEALKSWTPE